jgi:glucose/arabinose dehydrogenase
LASEREIDMARNQEAKRADRPNVFVEQLEPRQLLASAAGFSVAQFGAITAGTAMAFAPDGRLFVCTQDGHLRVVQKSGAVNAADFLTLTVDSNGERGLLGVAFDPGFSSNRFIYVYYTVPGSPAHNRVSRFTASAANPDLVQANSEMQLLNLDNLSGATNHNGGAIHFGSDGKLYVAVGENANGSNAQTFANRLGKMLRVNPDGSIPADNPYFNDPNVAGLNKAIFALGLRNPFTFAFQPTTGRLFINDVGESTWEEINDGIGHSNYGWSTIEGFRTTQTPPANYRDPLLTYNHSNGQTAIAGGAFYNPLNPTFAASYVGKYFFSDLGAGWMHFMDPQNPPGSANTGWSDFLTGASNPVDIQLGQDGALYYLQRGGTSGVYRITPLDSAAPLLSSSSFQFQLGHSLVYDFSENVFRSLTPSDITVQNVTTGTTIPASAMVMQYGANNIATITFPGLAQGLLPDGNYQITLNAAGVADAAGNPLAANNVINTFVLAGDASRNKTVDTVDFDILASNFGMTGRTFTQGNFDYSTDGRVDSVDFNILASRFNATLPSSPGTSPASAASAGKDTGIFSSRWIDPHDIDEILNG